MDQVNLTTPESRIMKTVDGFKQACNARAVVDTGSHLIVAVPAMPSTTSSRSLRPWCVWKRPPLPWAGPVRCWPIPAITPRPSRRFHLRGLHAAGGEWTLVCLASNLTRMHALAAST